MDVTRDVLDFMFILKSDVDPKDIKYKLEIKDWGMRSMSVHVNFTDPLQISAGLKPDEVLIKIKNKQLFYSLDSNRPLMADKIYI